MIVDPVMLSPLSALCGALIGGTTSLLAADTGRVGVCAGDGSALDVAEALEVTGGFIAAFPPPWGCADVDTRWYTPRPITASRAMTMATLQFSDRRSLILMGVAGWKTSGALIAPGAPCISSNSRISGSGSAPTTAAILRMWPLA